MTPLTRMTQILNDLEVVYKASFYYIDHAVFDAITNADKAGVLRLEYSSPGSKQWAEPLPIAKIGAVGKTMYDQLVVNTLISVVMLLNSYLRTMCAKALTVAPFDSTWYSFWHLSALSNLPELESVARFKTVSALVKFVDDYLDPRVNTAGLTHQNVLDSFGAIRTFTADFENAFMLANAHVKDTEL